MDQVAAMPMGDTGYAGGKMLAAVTDGVGRITFNQPEKRNAMSVEMWDGLVAILDACGRGPMPVSRAVVLTGAGDKAFVSGADISQFEKSRSPMRMPRKSMTEADELWPAEAGWPDFRKPVIAAHPGLLPRAVG